MLAHSLLLSLPFQFLIFSVENNFKSPMSLNLDNHVLAVLTAGDCFLPPVLSQPGPAFSCLVLKSLYLPLSTPEFQIHLETHLGL